MGIELNVKIAFGSMAIFQSFYQSTCVVLNTSLYICFSLKSFMRICECFEDNAQNCKIFKESLHLRFPFLQFLDLK
jgi:hypothetical protein